MDYSCGFGHIVNWQRTTAIVWGVSILERTYWELKLFICVCFQGYHKGMWSKEFYPQSLLLPYCKKQKQYEGKESRKFNTNEHHQKQVKKEHL